jgi:hypothetical protein
MGVRTGTDRSWPGREGPPMFNRRWRTGKADASRLREGGAADAARTGAVCVRGHCRLQERSVSPYFYFLRLHNQPGGEFAGPGKSSCGWGPLANRTRARPRAPHSRKNCAAWAQIPIYWLCSAVDSRCEAVAAGASVGELGRAQITARCRTSTLGHRK